MNNPAPIEPRPGQLGQERLLNLSDVTNIAGFKRAKLYRMMREGSFPKPIKFGHASRWPASEVQDWIEAHKLTRAA